jgi:signal transduction histidine kinase
VESQKLESTRLLAGGVAHTFNNILTGIMVGAGLAKDSMPGSHPAQPILQGVVRDGHRAAEVTYKMLAYAGTTGLRAEPTHIGELVLDTCENARRAIPTTISLECLAEPDLPLVATDPAQMRQVVADLITNSVEAIGPAAVGTISVRAALTELDDKTLRLNECATAGIAAGKFVAIDVRDNGCGMDEEIRRKVFDPFFSTKFTGRGLGLAAAHGFVRSNGGFVQVESSPGKGTWFRVLLPPASKTGNASRVSCGGMQL